MRAAWIVFIALAGTSCMVEEPYGPADRIVIRPYSLIVGEARAVPSVELRDAYGHTVAMPAPSATTFEITDTSIAKVTGDGRIVAGDKPGTTTIVARAQGFTTEAALTVGTNFFVWPNGMRLIPGGSRKPVVHAEALVGGRTVAQTVWETSDAAVAAVATDGTITGVANGETTIIARRGAFTASTRVVVAAYPKMLVFTDVGLSPRGICATEATTGTWCWGEHAAPLQSADRCVSRVGAIRDVECSASPVLMTTMTFAELVSPRADAWASLGSEPVGPYARTADGMLYQLGGSGPTAYVPGFAFRTFWAGRPMCGADLNGKGYCWQTNFDGYMGVGTVQPDGPWPQTPVAIASDKKFKQFVRGSAMCGLTEDGVAYCWGPNNNNEAGVGLNVASADRCFGRCIAVPTQTATDKRFTMLAGGGSGSPAGSGTVCGLTATQEPYCWSSHQTVNGGPSPVLGDFHFSRIESGTTICAIDAAGAAYCLSETTFKFEKVPLPFPVTRIVAGDKISCAISASDARLYCWGSGALGAGESVATATAANPVEVWGQR